MARLVGLTAETPPRTSQTPRHRCAPGRRSQAGRVGLRYRASTRSIVTESPADSPFKSNEPAYSESRGSESDSESARPKSDESEPVSPSAASAGLTRVRRSPTETLKLSRFRAGHPGPCHSASPSLPPQLGRGNSDSECESDASRRRPGLLAGGAGLGFRRTPSPLSGCRTVSK